MATFPALSTAVACSNRGRAFAQSPLSRWTEPAERWAQPTVYACCVGAAEPVNKNETVGPWVYCSGAASLCSVSACSSQYVIAISRYIVVAVVRCWRACSRLSVRR